MRESNGIFFMNPKFYTPKKYISRDKHNFGNTDKELDKVGPVDNRPGRPGPPQPRPPMGRTASGM